MKTTIGLWDALFGERVRVEIPSPIGGIRTVEVTKKWLEKMEGEGKMKPISSDTVKVNILDATGGVSFDQFDEPEDFLNALAQPKDPYRIEYWTIGKQVSKQDYEVYCDRETKELFALRKFENGKPCTHFVSRHLWELGRKAMKRL